MSKESNRYTYDIIVFLTLVLSYTIVCFREHHSNSNMWFQSDHSTQFNPPPPYEEVDSQLPPTTSHLYYVAGKTRQYTDRITEYRPDIQRWRPVYKGPLGEDSIAVGLMNKIYMFSDKNRFTSYDCSTGKIQKLSDTDFPYPTFAMANLNNVIYRSGGTERTIWTDMDDHYSTTFKYEPTNVVSRYDPERDAWHKVASMKHKRSGHLMVSGNGVLYAIGGNGKRFDIVEEYRSRSNTWFQYHVHGLAAFSTGVFHNGAVYLCGEIAFQRIILDSRSVIIPEVLLSPPNSKDSSLVSFNGKLLSVGGCLKGSTEQTPMVFEYDLQNGYWIRQPDMEIPRKGQGCVVVNF